MELSVDTYLLSIQALFPGAGVTVWNVWELPYKWWLQYVREVDAHVENAKKRG